MDFGEVLKGLKVGKKYARKGWNGKHMHIYMVEGRKIPLAEWCARSNGLAPTDAERLKGYVEVCGHIDMVSARGERIIGWLASQTDMLSDDWVEVAGESGNCTPREEVIG